MMADSCHPIFCLNLSYLSLKLLEFILNMANKDIIFHDEQTLIIVNTRGLLRQLRVPFQVRCIYPVGILKQDIVSFPKKKTVRE